jgi:hypothetical protein
VWEGKVVMLKRQVEGDLAVRLRANGYTRPDA